jgi:hypothetical protein
VAGEVLRLVGLVGLLLGAASYVVGRWNPDLDPGFLMASVGMLVLSVPVLWRVKPAPWP